MGRITNIKKPSSAIELLAHFSAKLGWFIVTKHFCAVPYLTSIPNNALEGKGLVCQSNPAP